MDYSTSHPAVSGGTVTQAHADHCDENGHATYTRDGHVAPYCSRCGGPLCCDSHGYMVKVYDRCEAHYRGASPR